MSDIYRGPALLGWCQFCRVQLSVENAALDNEHNLDRRQVRIINGELACRECVDYARHTGKLPPT